MRKIWEGEVLYEFKSTWMDEFKTLLTNLSKPIALVIVLMVCAFVTIALHGIQRGFYFDILYLLEIPLLLAIQTFPKEYKLTTRGVKVGLIFYRWDEFEGYVVGDCDNIVLVKEGRFWQKFVFPADAEQIVSEHLVRLS